MSARLIVAIAVIILPLKLVTSSFELTILHTNDVHSRFEQFTYRDGRCQAQDAESQTGCFGGIARRATVIKATRSRNKNVILLDAGDQFQGTPWFFFYKGKAASHFMNQLQYDVMSLGNHEFDNEVDGLIPFLRNLSCPVVCANADFSLEPELGKLVVKSTTLTIGGERVGVVGYLTTNTPVLSKSGKVRFEDEVTAVQAEVDRLTANGTTKIIALGHSGFAVDKQLAKRVTGIDVIIGGHTNTFTYTGTPPSTEVPEGPYPLVIEQSPGGAKVLVLEGYAFGKYIGYLQLHFDDQGRVNNWTGNPILLDKNVQQDEEFVNELESWGSEVNSFYNTTVGFTEIFLDGNFTHCRLEECNLGSLIADATKNQYCSQEKWTNLKIALWNGGGIRASIEPGNITYYDVTQVLPFGNTVDVVELTGSDLIQVLEHSVSGYSVEERAGKFLQVSGLRVIYDVGRENGNRVQEVRVVAGGCTDGQPQFVPLDVNEVYRIALPNYLAMGGDGFLMINLTAKQHYNLGDVDAEIVVKYLQQNSPVKSVAGDRIRFAHNIITAHIGETTSVTATTPIAAAAATAAIAIIVVLVVAVVVVVVIIVVYKRVLKSNR